jgi:hypothetical protein
MERVSSIFGQILNFFPRAVFEAAVRKHAGDKHAKGMTCWGQFIALMLCHLGGARSLREIIGGLAASEGKLKHLGVERAPKRSTLAYANQYRPWQLYRTVFEQLVQVCQGEARDKRRKFRFKHPLLTLDSTVIPVCVEMFEWAKYVKTKGAVKVHTVLDNRSILPQYAVITDGQTADVKVARGLKFEPSTIVVMDRGYEDHAWWRKLTREGVFFVSRLKDSTGYGIVEERPKLTDPILRDEVILLTSEPESDQPMLLRRVEVWLEDQQETMVFVSNHLRLAASTIAAIYRDRWQIGVSSQGHIVQSVRDRPRPKDSGLVAGEASWRESKTAEPSDNILRKECAQRTRLQRKVNADVASLHESPVAETVDNARKQQELTETSPKRQFSPAGYQRRHGVKDDVETGEALGARRRNLVEEMPAITVSGKCWHRHQGGGSGRSTDDGRAAKRARREGPGPVSIPSGKVRQG